MAQHQKTSVFAMLAMLAIFFGIFSDLFYGCFSPRPPTFSKLVNEGIITEVCPFIKGWAEAEIKGPADLPTYWRRCDNVSEVDTICRDEYEKAHPRTADQEASPDTAAVQAELNGIAVCVARRSGITYLPVR